MADKELLVLGVFEFTKPLAEMSDAEIDALAGPRRWLIWRSHAPISADEHLGQLVASAVPSVLEALIAYGSRRSFEDSALELVTDDPCRRSPPAR